MSDPRAAMTPAEAWATLREGNARFVAGEMLHPSQSADRRAALAAIDAPTLTQILERCARIGALTVSRPGANPPWAREL